MLLKHAALLIALLAPAFGQTTGEEAPSGNLNVSCLAGEQNREYQNRCGEFSKGLLELWRKTEGTRGDWEVRFLRHPNRRDYVIAATGAITSEGKQVSIYAERALKNRSDPTRMSNAVRRALRETLDILTCAPHSLKESDVITEREMSEPAPARSRTPER